MKLTLLSVPLIPFPLTALPAPSRFLRRPQLLTCLEPLPMGRDISPPQSR
jgi:hypothetical protein